MGSSEFDRLVRRRLSVPIVGQYSCLTTFYPPVPCLGTDLILHARLLRLR